MPSPSLVRCFDEIIEAVALWDIGATGAHTKTAGYPGTAFASVTRTGAGAYTVNFNPNVPSGPFLELYTRHLPAATTAPMITKFNKASYVRPSATGNGSCTYEAWTIGTTPALADLPSGDKLMMVGRWLKTS